MKACKDCRRFLPLSDFNLAPENKDGHANYCRACAAVRWAAYSARKRAQREALPPKPMPEGAWRPIGDDGNYFVSDDGRVWSVRRGAVLQGRLSHDGYHKVQIGSRRQVSVHRLVAEAFIGPPEPGQQVRHKDGVKLNNSASNLEWGTCQQNILDKWKHGKMVVGEKHHNNKIPESEIPLIRASRESNTRLAEKYGVTRTAIYLIRKGKNYGWC